MPKKRLLRCVTAFLVLAAFGMGRHAYAADVQDNFAALDEARTSYFPVLPFEAPPDAEPQLVPVASNHPLDGDHAGITSAVIVIHDFMRDAPKMLSIVSTLAGTNNATTLIVAPQFLLDFDIARLRARLPENGRVFARWPLDGWQNGGSSIAQAPGKPISSFTVVDLLLMYLSDKKSFPDMGTITVAGHGEGGDFVQRYAASGRAPEVIGAQGPPIRFLVADASAYLYLTDLRPRVNKPGFVTPDAASCPGFNAYPYGLDKLNDYVQRVGATAIKLGYAARPITYLIGEKAAVSDPLPDDSCAAALQGPNRVMRAANYDVYLYQTFGDAEAKNQKFVTVPAAGYDAAALFGSPCGLAVLFGDGNCAPPPLTGVKNPQ
jgi:hypothetical protein